MERVHSRERALQEPNQEEGVGLADWQMRQLPLMTRMVVGLAVFFFLASLGQLVYLHWNVRNAPPVDLEASYALLDAGATAEERVEAFRHRTLVQLEVYAIERLYHQANVLLMARIWTRYLGFVTGMILALVGAVFILGKLQGPESTATAETGGAKYSLTSASPGILLAGFGVALMMTTIITHHEIAAEHRPVYARPYEDAEAERFLEPVPDERLERPGSLPPTDEKARVPSGMPGSQGEEPESKSTSGDPPSTAPREVPDRELLPTSGGPDGKMPPPSGGPDGKLLTPSERPDRELLRPRDG